MILWKIREKIVTVQYCCVCTAVVHSYKHSNKAVLISELGPVSSGYLCVFGMLMIIIIIIIIIMTFIPHILASASNAYFYMFVIYYSRYVYLQLVSYLFMCLSLGCYEFGGQYQCSLERLVSKITCCVTSETLDLPWPTEAVLGRQSPSSEQRQPPIWPPLISL